MGQTSKHKSGFVALVGRPNVGKSTLMNRLIGQKVAITSAKPQTTRNKISGIYTEDDMQVVFVDTPGIFKSHSDLDEYMDKASLSSLKDVDLVMFMVDAKEAGKGEEYVAGLLKDLDIPVFLVINKIDQVHPNDLLPIIDSYQAVGKFAEFLPISARQGNGVDDLLKTLKDYLPEGPQYYASDEVTDRPEYFVVAEMIREQILRLTDQEVPHSTAVWVDQMNQRINGKLQIDATIFVEKDGQKRIIIGQRGSMIKQIGMRSRKEIENLLGEKVNLKLWVKVRRDWRQDPAFLKSIGYDKKEL
ncbi:GTPase Era [Lactobacillus delbrueckii subsp. lactis]|mgnify:CR=1 FL=1|jgi:GTPase|uniref:GTPase Era n=4 Tax=Lactobacillus TaxID=1578 RepID=A0A061CSX1_LACDL|nr:MULTISPECIES: GTPase Era [Lactobacillus]ADQ61176.1 GTP-binding protein era-like protein [Lactobacillus delbrueckii subsp. bulgaricus ND02]APG66881.1 GTPase Era [Lactobacillus delbrueckii subsp. lactis]APG69179.1 GTPase Era [Lactobacillus delbrueckii subsp. lactis]APG71505.1 GTPase Era [Lactobacillus delbrueckii subsp. delbrueckii]ASW12145.1 GTPase Era [Lactobacillus delbrueckii subsp. lactis DSM 20072]